MKREHFPFPMKRVESILGWVWLAVHIFILPYVVRLLDLGLQAGGTYFSSSQLNILYFAICFVFLLCAMFRYLKNSSADLVKNVTDTLRALLFGFLVYFIAQRICTWILNWIVTGRLVFSTASLSEMIASSRLNEGVSVWVAALLAPVVEEVLFRGVAFGTLQKTSRLLAYVVSIFLFALYFLWEEISGSFAWSDLLYMLRYVPAGFVLAWCYEKSHTIIGPILLHILFNFVSISITIGGLTL